MSSFRHCNVGVVTRVPFILVHNLKEAGSVREGLLEKVISQLDVMVRVEEQCAVGCT